MTAVATILDDVLRECNFRAQGNYAQANSMNEQQAFGLANRAVADIMRWPWMALRSFHEITLTSSETYDLPSDFHKLIPDTTRANARITPVEVNTDPSQWSYLKTQGGLGGTVYRVRVLGSKLYVHEPVAGEVLRFEYVSNSPIYTGGDSGQPATRFTTDTDTWRLDDELLALNVIWRFKQAKGFDDWAKSEQDYERYLRDEQSRDRPARTVNMVKTPGPIFDEPYSDDWVA